VEHPTHHLWSVSSKAIHQRSEISLASTDKMKESFRDSDVELRNSAMADELSENPKNRTKSTSKNLRTLLISGIVVSFLFFLAIILSYFLVYEFIDHQVKAVSEVSD
jgi:hypothetical protein